MKKSYLLGAVCAFTLAVLANTAHAVVLNPILDLDIGGTLYDVTFYGGVGDSFNALWDQDDDGVFGGGTSVFSVQPTFWDNQTGANAAASAIIAALGTTYSTNPGGDDIFFIPWAANPFTSGVLTAGPDPIVTNWDTISGPCCDELGTEVFWDYEPLWPYAIFTPSVPIPASLWLFGSGLLGLVGMARRKV